MELELEEGERILWEGKPKFWPYWIPSFLYVPVGLFVLLYVIPLSFILFGSPLDTGTFSLLNYLIFLFYIPIYFATFGALLWPVFSWIAHHYESYALTNSRLFVRRGILNIETEDISFREMVHIGVGVGWQDSLFGGETATVEVELTDGSSRYIRNVEEPYEVLDFMESGP